MASTNELSHFRTGSIFEEERLMNFRLLVFLSFLITQRAAHVATRVGAVLAKSTIGTGVLLGYFPFHKYILQFFFM
jgi:hypothetical protein